jgi:hypothetical protein
MYYKVGYALVCVWLVAVLYGCERYNDNDEVRASLALLAFITGLILFPIYFLSVFFVQALWKRRHR